MPYSPQEKTRILFYLGYSGFEDDGPAMRAINGIDGFEDRVGFLVRDLMEKIEQIRCKVHEVITLTDAVQVADIQIRPSHTLSILWRIGRQYVSQLGLLLKVSRFSDIFAPAGRVDDPPSFYSGDPSERRIDSELGLPTRTSGY